MWLLFLRDTSLQALLISVGYLHLFYFSPAVWLFLVLSYTKVMVAWAIIYLRKSSLIRRHTGRIPYPQFILPISGCWLSYALWLLNHALALSVCSRVFELNSEIQQCSVSCPLQSRIPGIQEGASNQQMVLVFYLFRNQKPYLTFTGSGYYK